MSIAGAQVGAKGKHLGSVGCHPGWKGVGVCRHMHHMVCRHMHVGGGWGVGGYEHKGDEYCRAQVSTH